MTFRESVTMPNDERMEGGKSKVERYDWKPLDKAGEPRLIDKATLEVDESYQRPRDMVKAIKIARVFSWVACGAIIVARRDGRYFVIDGHHRVLAARKRADISKLQCLVFETDDAKQEAKGFLDANSNRKPLMSVDNYRALLRTEDEVAEYLEGLLKFAGREAKSTPGPGNVRCMSLLITLARTQRQPLTRAWPVVVAICEGHTLSERVVSSLVYIESRMPPDESIGDPKWRKRLVQVGYSNLMEAAGKAAAFYAKGGARVWALGVIEAMNKGLRNRLEVDL